MERGHLSGRDWGYTAHPDYRVWLERTPKRVRVFFDGVCVVDSLSTSLLFETRHTPVYYFPESDIEWSAMHRTEHTTYCPFKGDASYWNVATPSGIAENAMWSYERPFSVVPDLKAHYAFYWQQASRWMEEDEEVYVHPKSPYVRVDVLDCEREVVVSVAGREVARSKRARVLFETGLPPRYYLPRADVNEALLTTSERRSMCPYKGQAGYLTVSGDSASEPEMDICWFYAAPLPEVARIADYLCFYNERVDIDVDGVRQPTPRTKWSKR